MDDFAIGSDISEVIDRAVIRLTQMDVLKRAGKTSGPSGSDRDIFSHRMNGRTCTHTYACVS